MDDIIDTFNYTYIDEYNSIVLEEKDHIYEIISSNSKVNNPKTSSLYLKNCEKSLKSYYGIPDNESLIILKLDAYREGQTGPTVEYQIYYSFNEKALEQLDLTLCEGDGVSILISYNMTEGEEDQYMNDEIQDLENIGENVGEEGLNDEYQNEERNGDYEEYLQQQQNEEDDNEYNEGQMNEEYEYGEEQEENMEEMGNNDYRNEEMENYDKNDLEINDLDI